MKVQFACLLVICFLRTIVFSADGFHSGALSDINRRENYAVVNLKVGEGVTNGDAELISDRLRAEIFNIGNVNVMERNQMQDILKEQGFQQSGATCTDEACLVQLGQMLGVQFLVAGSLGRLGTLYMVNVRAIDVQTGKIVRVVSVDVKGNIEDLVDHLPRIAMQLTGVAKKPKQTVITTMAAKDTSTAVVVEAKPGSSDGQANYEVDDTDVNKKNEKNRNRSGVGLTLDILGKPGRLIGGHESNDRLLLFDFDSTSSFVPLTKYEYDITKSQVINIGLNLFIKAGSLLEIDIAPAIALASEKYTLNKSNIIARDGQHETANITYTVPSLAAGLSLTKRMLPLKLNVGAFVNFMVPVTSFDYSILPAAASKSISKDATITSFAVGFGARAGAEYVIAQRIGIAADLVFNWARYDASFDFDDTEDPMTVQTVIFPMLGFGLGVNYYF
ncbi:MAG: CsgG/HfaB family protein [Fibrobacterota bacterium]